MGPLDAPMRALHAALWILIATAPGILPARGETIADTARAALRTKQFSRAIEVLRSSAERGDVESQYLLGLACASGIGAEPSEEQAQLWLTRAAEQSHTEAAFALAGLFAVRGSTARAQEWLHRAAVSGHPLARELEQSRQLPLHARRVTGAGAPSAFETLLWSLKGQSASALPTSASDLAAQDAFGRSVLAHATALGSAEAVSLMLAAGVSAEAADQFGTTALMLAAQGESQNVFNAVLPVSTVNARDSAGNTALMYAARAGRTDQVSALVRSRADLNTANSDGWTALDLATRWEHAEVVSVLREAGATGRLHRQANVAGVDPSRRGELYRNWPELAVAASRDDAALVTSLLAGGASPDARTPAGDTALLVAAKSGAAQVVAPLITAGADIRQNDAAGVSALGIAARRSDLALLDVLLKNGAARSKEAASAALIEATRSRRTSAVRRLLEAGADVNASGSDGVTALMISARSNDRALIEALLGSHPMLDQEDRNGRRAIWHAAASAGGDAVELLLDAGASAKDGKAMSSPLMAAVRARHVDSVQKLLRHEAPVNPADASAVTPLMAAAQIGSAEMISALIAAGADVNRQDEAGDTALIVAARGGHLEGCRVLLAAGANVSLRNGDRLSAVDVARRGHFTKLGELLD